MSWVFFFRFCRCSVAEVSNVDNNHNVCCRKNKMPNNNNNKKHTERERAREGERERALSAKECAGEKFQSVSSYGNTQKKVEKKPNICLIKSKIRSFSVTPLAHQLIYEVAKNATIKSINFIFSPSLFCSAVSIRIVFAFSQPFAHFLCF